MYLCGKDVVDVNKCFPCVLPMTDVLPEWSTVDAEEIETGGSFDASGAFLSSKVTARHSLFTSLHAAIHT